MKTIILKNVKLFKDKKKNSFDKILITRDYSSGAGLVLFICM